MRLLPVSSILSLFFFSVSVYLFPSVFLYDDRIVIPGVSFFHCRNNAIIRLGKLFYSSFFFKAFTFDKSERGCGRKCFATCFDIALKELNCWNVLARNEYIVSERYENVANVLHFHEYTYHTLAHLDLCKLGAFFFISLLPLRVTFSKAHKIFVQWNLN